MRKYLGLLVVVGLVAGASVAHAATVTLVRGGAAIGTYEQTSADGCEITTGEIAVLEAKQGGELANGLYVTAMRENICTGAGAGWAGYVEGDFDVVGLFFARFTGTAVIESYSGAAPLTFELDLRWFGTGPVSRDHGFFRDETTIDFSFSGSRAAITVGSFTIDGVPATVTSASIVRQTSGHIVR